MLAPKTTVGKNADLWESGSPELTRSAYRAVRVPVCQGPGQPSPGPASVGQRNRSLLVSPVSALGCNLAFGGFDGRMAGKAIYGFRRSRSELDVDGARYYPGRNRSFVVVTPVVRLTRM
jgi:hypothetical protein